MQKKGGVKEGDVRGNYNAGVSNYTYKKEAEENYDPEKLDEALEGLDDLDSTDIENSYTMMAKPKRIGKVPTKVQLRRLQVHRLVLRGVSRPVIARHLNVSMETVYKDCSLVYKAIRDELQSVDLPAFVGITVAFYDDIRNSALRIATDDKEKSNTVKLRALEVALKIEDSKQNYLGKLGLYGNSNAFKSSDSEVDVAADLLDAISELVNQPETSMQSIADVPRETFKTVNE